VFVTITVVANDPKLAGIMNHIWAPSKVKSLTMRILSSTESKSLGILCLRPEEGHGIFASLSKQV